MKAISIQQPWAWLIVNGHKDIENRDWRTHFTGPILIHAGKKLDKEAVDYIRSEHPGIALPNVFDLGGIVGRATITGCVKESKSRWFFGDYGFTLRNASTLPFRPYRGQLGFFEVQDPVSTEQSTPTANTTATSAD